MPPTRTSIIIIAPTRSPRIIGRSGGLCRHSRTLCMLSLLHMCFATTWSSTSTCNIRRFKQAYSEVRMDLCAFWNRYEHSERKALNEDSSLLCLGRRVTKLMQNSLLALANSYVESRMAASGGGLMGKLAQHAFIMAMHIQICKCHLRLLL